MKIAIPIAQDKLCLHFGHCEQFMILQVDADKRQILETSKMSPPPHEPGVLPRWLSEQGVTVVIAGGMGGRARDLFTNFGIRVITGAPVNTPDKIVAAFLDGSLELGENTCDH